MKNHWLPRFYLNRFTKERSCFLWLYFKDTKRYEYKSTKVIARQKGYYTKAIENLLCIIENMTAPVLLKIDNKEKLTEIDKWKIAIFISFLRVRVPFFAKTTRKGFDESKKVYLNENFSTEDKAQLFIDKFEKKYLKKADMNVKELLAYINSDPPELQLSSNKWFFNLMTRIGQKQINLLLNMSWAFVYAHKDSSFITCDNPFILYDLERNLLNGLFGVAGKNIIKLIPLGRKVCLFVKELTNNPIIFNYEIHSKKEMRLLNTYIVDNSNELLISGDKEQLEKLVRIRIKK